VDDIPVKLDQMDGFVSHEMRRKQCKSGKRTFRIARAQANASPFEGVLLDGHDFLLLKRRMALFNGRNDARVQSMNSRAGHRNCIELVLFPVCV
jgi:hypothetical protein